MGGLYIALLSVLLRRIANTAHSIRSNASFEPSLDEVFECTFDFKLMNERYSRNFFSTLVCCLLSLTIAVTPTPAFAYIGPGAGFALAGSSAVFLGAIGLGIVGILFLPFRLLRRLIRYRTTLKGAKIKRLIVLGFDGMDPNVTDEMLGKNELPALQAMRDKGGYWRLKSTIPSMSPVAWSTFQTGVNPGSHNVFDFLTRDKRTYLPGMVSVDTAIKTHWLTKKKSEVPVLTRKSKPFWKVLGDHGVFNTILRVPISYPPERLHGNILSAMCTPDIRGSQGTFMFFSTDQERIKSATSGEFNLLKQGGETCTGIIKGPTIGEIETSLSFTLTILNESTALLTIENQEFPLALNTFSPWIKLSFKAEKNSISGISRFLLQKTVPDISLYVSPVNVDPETPALPISSPQIFSRWLARTIGSFGTLGFLEDTWGRNEHALDDQAFIDQLMANHAERESMLYEVLSRVKRGLCICVFDGTDRIQHMFWRYREKNHPAPREANPAFTHAIEDVYKAMDKVVAKVMAEKGPGDEVIVLSDHGFGSFRRCVNLNRWLVQEEYLVLKPGCDGAKDYLVDVDWGKTRAFALGITGIYLNRKGREREGIVLENEAEKLAREISAKLKNLRDDDYTQDPIKNVFLATDVYKGLYTKEAPDLIVGYANGYRVSWESVTGAVETNVFSDNTKAWSGDHHINPDDVPGILFSTLAINSPAPALIDLAPTVLKLFGVKAPGYMEGKSLV